MAAGPSNSRGPDKVEADGPESVEELARVAVYARSRVTRAAVYAEVCASARQRAQGGVSSDTTLVHLQTGIAITPGPPYSFSTLWFYTPQRTSADG